jgi:predicted GIY-YIG superfamily endonuclease
MKIYRLYKITNDLNSKVYIGATSESLSRRFIKHKSRARREAQMWVHSEMSRLGVEHFQIKEIELVFGKQGALNRESYWIHHYNSKHPTGYNTEPAKRLVCITTGQTFRSTYQASRALKIPQPSIFKVLSKDMKQTHSLEFEWVGG